MGRALAAVVEADPALQLVAGFDRPRVAAQGLVDVDPGRARPAGGEADPALQLGAGFERPGVEAEGLVDVDAALAAADCVIDFPLPAASAALAPKIAAAKVAWIVGATGFQPEHIAPITE